MNRRDFTKSEVAAVLVGSLAQTAVADGRGAPPNVLYLFSDTHRWCSMDFTETPEVGSPAMRAMMKNGVSFSNCYSTLPICSPHRAILMTGHWPWQQGFVANHMSLADRVDGAGPKGTLGWMFKHSGYRTYYAGKWHMGGNSAVPYGFDWSCIWGNEDHTNLSYAADGAGNPCGTDPKMNWMNDRRYSGTAAHDARPADPRFPYKIIGETDHALLFLDEHLKHHAASPFFLMLSLQDAHGPWRKKNKKTYPPYLQDRYDPDTVPRRDNDTLDDKINRMDYHASVNAVDAEVARVRRYLKDKGLSNNTILVYSSDHGGMLGTQGVRGGQKRWPHDESTHVPFMVEWPGGMAAEHRGRDCTALFSSIDIFPTICHLAGLPARLAGNGETGSLEYLRACPGINHALNVVGDSGGPDPESLFICHPSNMNNGSRNCPVTRTVVTRNYMYSVEGKTRVGTRDAWTGWDPEGQRERWMYDRVKDPRQLNNLISDPSHEETRKGLRRELARWLDKAETPFVQNWFDHMNPKEVKAWKAEHDGLGRAAAFKLTDYIPAS